MPDAPSLGPLDIQRPLTQSEQRFRAFVEGVSDYAIYTIDPTGVITSWNAGAEHIKGYTASEVIGRHFSLFYTPADLAARVPERALQTAAQSGKFEAEGWRVRKDGSSFWASI